MKRKIKPKTTVAMALAAIMATSACVMAAPSKTAVPSDANVMVEKQLVDIGAYNIDGYNYFKLRDVAAAMNQTDAHFAVGYDEKTQSIVLTTNKEYVTTGNELKDKPVENKSTTTSNQTIILNGKEVEMQAYLIDGYNYFQLRDLGEKLGFDVGWDSTTKTISLKSKHITTPVQPEGNQGSKPNVDKIEKDDDTKDEVSDGAKTTKDLQALFDDTSKKSDGSINLTGTYRGNPGDIVYIKSSKADFAIFGKNAKIENITLVVDSNKPVWIEGVTFEGNDKTETAVVVKNTVARSMASGIIRCEFKNYTGDTVVIENLEPWKQPYNTAFLLSESYFYQYGTNPAQQNAAIAIRPTKAIKAHLSIDNNHFHLENEPISEETIDYSIMSDFDNPEFLSELTVLHEYNMIQEGEMFWAERFLADIPEENWKF